MLTIMAPLAQFLATEGIEGIRLQTYDDKTGDRLDAGETAEGTASIAVGLIEYADGSPVEPGDELTLQEAWDETYHYLNKVLTPALERLISVNLPDHKLMAFSSWLYNFGETKARRYSLPKLINSGADDRAIIEKWMEYINAGGKPELGLYRRRMAEVLMWMDLDWRPALNVTFDDSIFDVITELGGEVPEADTDLFEEPEIPRQGAPVTKKRTIELPDNWDELSPNQQTAWLNGDQRAALADEPTPKVAVTTVTPKVPVKAYEYLNDDQKEDLQVKEVGKSQRGRAVGKKAVSKGAGAAGIGGVVTIATGTAEPVLKIVDKYPKETLAYVSVLLIVIGIIWHFWSEWQLQKGRDEADTLLG